MNILIIEDDETIRLGLKYYLEQESFHILMSGEGNIGLLSVKEADMVLLDVNLPDTNGFDLFPKIKAIKDIPVIFLTANDLEVSIVMGLDMGADDYITKPFKARELVSRIKNVMRRNNKQSSNIIHLGNVTLDVNQAKVVKQGREVMLTTLEYKIFLILALNPNVTFTREKILADIWDVNEEYVNDNTLTVYIKRIRDKIEDNPIDPKIILTIRGIGYKIGESC